MVYGCGAAAVAAGLCAGGGFTLKRFGFGLAYAQYHLSAPSLVFSAAYRM